MAGLFDDLIAPAAPAAAAPAPAGGLFDDLVSAVPLPPARPASFTEESMPTPPERPAELGGAPATIDMPPMQALDDVAPRVTPEPAAKPGMLSTIGSALTRGARDALTDVSDAANPFTAKPEKGPDVSELGQLLQTPLSKGWTDPNWWAAKIAYGTAAGSPMLGGAVAGAAAGAATPVPGGALMGGALGGALGSAVQTIAPAYQRAVSEGLDHDAAVDRAIKETGIASAFGGAMGLAPAATSVLRAPISEALLQIFGVQPGLAVAQHAATNAVTDRPLDEGLGETAAVGAAQGAVLAGAHHALRGRPVEPSKPADINDFLDDAARVSPVPHGNEAAADFAFGGAHAIDRADRLLPPPNGSTNVTPDSGTARPSGPGEHAAAPVEEPRAPAAPVEPGPSDPGLRADGQDPNGDRHVPPQAAAVEPEVRPVSGELGTKALTPKDEADTRLLLGAGYDLEEIGDMGRRARVAAIKEAQNDGVKPFEGPLPGAAEEAQPPAQSSAPTTPTPLFDDLVPAPAPVDKPVESSAVSRETPRETPAPDQADKADLPPLPAEKAPETAPADGAAAKSPTASPPKGEGPKAAKPGRPKNLLEYLASEGGLAPNADLAYHGADKHVVPFHGRLVREGGLDLDEARRRAVEAGYLHDTSYDAGSNLAPGSGASTSTTSDLLEAIDESLRGRHVFSTRDEARRAEIEAKRKKPRVDPDQELHHARNSVLDYLTENGIPEEHAHPEFLDRAAQLVLKGEHSIEDAYERAVMEAVEGHEAVAKRAKKENIPFDAPKPRTAPPAREDRAGGERAGDRPGDEVAAPGRGDVPAEPQDREGAGEPQRVEPQRSDPVTQEQLDALVAEYLPEGWKASFNPDGTRAFFHAPGPKRRGQGGPIGTGTLNEYGEILDTLKGMQRARESDERPKRSDPIPLPTDNYRKRLSTYADRLYRETSIESFFRLIPSPLRVHAGNPFGRDELFVSKTRDLALGQGENKGVMVHFDPGKLEGQINKKPGWDFAWQNGEAEFRANPIHGASFPDAVISFEITNGAKAPKALNARLRNALADMRKAGWTETAVEGGKLYTRPGAQPTSEPGAEGKPQLVIPGAEKIGQGEQAQRKADAPLKPKADQKDTDGLALFGDGHKQGDLLDAKPVAAEPSQGGHSSERLTGEKQDQFVARRVAEMREQMVGKVDLPASESDEIVHAEVTERGPWDFNDTWPAPDFEQLARMEWEGRFPLESGEGDHSPEQIINTLDETLNELVGYDASARYSHREIEGLKKGTIQPKRKQTRESAIKGAEQSFRLAKQGFQDLSATAGEVWGRDAMAAMIREARQRAATELRQTPITPQPADHVPEQKPLKGSGDLATDFAAHFEAGKGFRTILEARRFAKERGTDDVKAVEEALELGVVKTAREIAKQPDAFDKLVDLYDRQPTLGTRTSTSMRDQAYSTPIPLAYVASRLAHASEGWVLEPTAGNGALLIEVDPAQQSTTINELNGERAKNLTDLGFRPTGADASAEGAFAGESRKVDVVLANPPFGAVKENGESRRFDLSDIQPGYSTNEIDHVISLRALETLRDNGRAALIIGAPNGIKDRSDGYNGKAKREFFKTLYDRYNVADHFTVNGDLYKKQGAGWPVDVIVIDGRGKSARKLPAADVPPVLSSWDELKGKLTDVRPARGDRSEVDRAPASAGPGGPARGDDGDRVEAGGSGPPAVQPKPVEPGSVRKKRDRGQPGPSDTGRPDLRGERDGGGQPARPDKPANAGGRAQSVELTETETQKSYKPASTKAKSLGTLVPTNMQSPTAEALRSVSQRRGDLDTFVGKSLGYKVDAEGPYFIRDGQKERPFAAEQVDALALALDNIDRGAGFIIGDQTGIGKGRVNAGIVRFAMEKGHIPIFITKDAALYKDIYRDLIDTGIVEYLGREPRILMTNASQRVPLDDEGREVLKSGDVKEHNALLNDLAAAGSIGDYDLVATTYSQMQTVRGESTERQRFLEAIAPNAVLAMDEAHNAGTLKKTFRQSKNAKPKAPDRAEFSRTIIDRAKAAFYSSATYAKRPDMMDLYRKTDMRLAVKNVDELAEAIEAGGVPMQQAVASMLSQAGQYVRRERSFHGVQYDPVVTPVGVKVYDQFSQSLALINDFSRVLKQVTKQISEGLKADAEAVGHDNAVGQAGADSMNFTSIMHNLINQMLLSINAKPAAEAAIAAVREGEKPLIALASTNESFLSDYAKEVDLKPGDAVDLDFTQMLDRYLERSRWITIRKPFMREGEKAEKERLTDDQLGPVGRAAFKRAKDFLKETDFSSLPVSPIDYIRGELKRAGVRVGEITGRNLIVEYGLKGQKLATRPRTERSTAGKNKTIRDFNNGDIDALILNQSGSTGLSMHASERVKDQKKRHMIIAQAEGNIDTHMQMLGRVHRTGQVVTPRYTQLIPDIPAAKRPAAVLAKKMASLNANTTASRKSALSGESNVDFMNQYGDRVARMVMADELELHARMDNPINFGEEKTTEGNMRKVTGRIPLLPIAEQKRLYDRLEGSYKNLIERLESEGKNMLEAKTLELDAKPVETIEAEPTAGPSVFQGGVALTTYNVKHLGKPFEVKDLVAHLAHGSGLTDVPSDPVKALEAASAAGARLREHLEKSALEGFQVFRQKFLERMTDEEKIEAQRVRLNGQETDFKAKMALLAPGSRVRVVYGDGEATTGVVVKLSTPPKDATNPIAPGQWAARIAVPNGAGTIEYPFNSIKLDSGDLDAEEVRVEPVQSWVESPAQTIESFDRAAKADQREKRVIATGNILKAFTSVAKNGQIINFRDHKGEVRPGIMLRSKVKSLEDAIAGKKLDLSAEQAAKKILEGEGVPVTSSDGNVTLTNNGRAVMVAIAKAKDKGGQYYLNDGVIAAAGRDFVSRGSMMRADVPLRATQDLVKALTEAGAKFTAPAEFDASKVVKVEDAGKMARVESAPKVARVDDTMRAKIKEIVRRQAGPHVNLEFLDRLDLAPGELARSSGGDPAAVPSGFFDPYENLIAIATGTLHPEESAYHEAMHYLEAAGVFTPQEAALMRASRGSMEKYLSRSIDPERLARMPQHELNGYASEAYQKERDAGEPLHTAGAGLHIGIKRAFEKLRRFWEAILNAAKGLGFETWRDVIDRQRSGELAGRVRPEDQGSNAAAMLNEKGRMARVERRRAAVEPSRGERLAKGWNTLIENVQNLHLPKRDLQAELEARKGEELPDQHAFYERARLYPGRRAAQIEDFNRDMLDPLIDVAKRARISQEEADDHNYALHAEERNERIDAINPAVNGMGSGMSDEEARAILERVEADPRRAAFEQIAEIVQRMRHFEIDTLENAGLISEQYADELRNGYKHYVSLSGFADEGDAESRYLGAGKFAVRGKEHEQALGRLSKANSPIENMVNQAYQAIGRAERNRVVDSLARALKSLGKENVADIVSFDKGEPKRILDPKTGLVTWVDDSSFRFSPNAVPYKVGGKTRYLVFKDARLAEAMKRSAPDELNDVLRHVLRATNEIKSLWTHYSPNFLIRHFLFRYPIEGAMNFFEAKEANPDASVLRFMAHSAPFLGPAYKAIRAVQSGERGGAWGDLYNEMRQHGGMVGLAAMRDIDAEFKNLRSEMAGWTKNANPLRLRRAFIRAMSTATSALDNSIRLAAYKQFREGGMSPQKASLRARDATVDFQLKGRKSDWMGLIWPFANVAIQTGVRLTGATARSRMIRRAALGMMLSGLLLGAANYLLAGKDDDGEYFFDKVPDWEKRLNLIVMTGRKDERLHIPMPYNWAFPMVAGYALANTIFGNKSVRKQLGMVTKSALELVTPIGQEENPIAMFAPEVVRPLIHVRTNESWNGSPVHTESKFQKGPNSMNGRDSTGEGWKMLARGVNSATGGSIASKGVVDMYPEDYRHIFDEVIGAQRRLIGGLSETVSDAKAGREFKPGGVPGLSVVYGKGDAKLHDRSAYYEERSHIQAARDEVDTLTKHRPPTATDDDVASAVQRNAPVLAAEPVVKAAEKQLLPLRKTQRQLAAMPRTAEIDQALDDNRKAQDAIMKQSLTVLHQMRASGR